MNNSCSASLMGINIVIYCCFNFYFIFVQTIFLSFHVYAFVLMSDCYLLRYGPWLYAPSRLTLWLASRHLACTVRPPSAAHPVSLLGPDVRRLTGTWGDPLSSPIPALAVCAWAGHRRVSGASRRMRSSRRLDWRALLPAGSV